MVQSQVSVHIDGCNNDSFATPKAYRSPPWQAVGLGQQQLDWLELEWGLSAIDAIADPGQGVSETWWRVFKERQMG